MSSKELSSYSVRDRRVIIQLVPDLPPKICGVGDYALALARQLRTDYQLETRFLVCNPEWSGDERIDGFNVYKLNSRTGFDLVSQLKQISQIENEDTASKVLLHYSGFGYQIRGCPVWLADGLGKWKQVTKKNTLMTYFHELYFCGPPWRRSFWMTPLQKFVLSGLIKWTDIYFTSNDGYKARLLKHSSGKHCDIKVLPVFSNVGEIASPISWYSREPVLVVFGNRVAKLQAYQDHRSSLVFACKSLGVRRILDIGVKTGATPKDLDGCPIQELGPLTPDEILNIMSISKAGFLSRPQPLKFSKSGIFASYAASGLLPISPYLETSNEDGLKSGVHYWAANKNGSPMSDALGQAIVSNVRKWYLGHNLKRHSMMINEAHAEKS